MARNDMCGLFWDDTPEIKIKKEKVKAIPPEPVWLYDTYLPGLQEAIKFDISLFTIESLQTAQINKEPLVFDLECYENYFLAAFKSVVTGKICYWEMTTHTKLERELLEWVVSNFTLISFNGWNYDIPILTLALAGRNCAVLKQATNDLIQYGIRPYDILKNYKVKKIKKLDHIDLIEVAPLSANLKLYGGRLHCHKMQDLPFHPDKLLSPEQIAITRLYCVNDLDNTELLYNSLRTELELRDELSAKYGIDLRSKSDAQIAEAVIKSDLSKRGMGKINIPEVVPKVFFYYKAPEFIKFQHLDILERLANNPFFIKDNGKPAACYYADFIDWGDKSLRLSPDGEWVRKPKDWVYKPIIINGTQYTMGIGGLHSVEKSISYYSNEEYTLKDVDVESYYPRTILNLKLFPKQIGSIFLNIFDIIVRQRIRAKQEKRKKDADSLKIVINGLFGKFGSTYSIVYSPDLIIQTTITGQLCLLMLIERLELAGIKVISANTDGVVSYVHKSQDLAFEAIVKQWEIETGYKMEETIYKSLHSRDINNYIAIKSDGVKHKGAYSNHWNDNSTFRLHKNPTNLICIDAVTDYLTKQIPIDHTIRNCKDVTKFITVRDVKGGAVKMWSQHDILYLGKSIRWYYSNQVEGDLIYAKSGNKVPRSDGARPLMELPNQLPSDINYDWYIEESNKILTEIGINI